MEMFKKKQTKSILETICDINLKENSTDII